MEKYTLKDNTVDNYIPVTPVTPQIGYIHKEESQQFSSRDYNWDGVTSVPETSTVDTYSETYTRKNLTSDVKDIPTNSANSATDYIGVVKYDVPHIIDETFANFSLLDINTNPYTTLQSADIESLAVDLYDSTDTNPKIVSLFNGLQAIRIPANRLNTLTTTPTTFNYGKYYIKVSPKYIETPVTGITLRSHVEWQNIDLSSSEGRRQIINCSNVPFASSPWNFNLYKKQRGRLHGSIVEIWDSSKTTKKQTKVSVENSLGLDGTSGIAAFVITPDVVGYDAPDQVIGLGDIIRVYPRETYFNPIYIEVDYQNKDLDLESLIKFMKNDAARNLVSGTIEIYDENGVIIDNAGNLNGTVIQAYQITTAGTGKTIEVRRKINL